MVLCPAIQPKHKSEHIRNSIDSIRQGFQVQSAGGTSHRERKRLWRHVIRIPRSHGNDSSNVCKVPFFDYFTDY